MSGEPYQLLRVWSVGDRYRVTLTIPRVKPGEAVVVAIEWSPYLPKHLTPEELRDYRAGRDAALLDVAKATGINTAVVEA